MKPVYSVGEQLLFVLATDIEVIVTGAQDLSFGCMYNVAWVHEGTRHEALVHPCEVMRHSEVERKSSKIRTKEVLVALAHRRQEPREHLVEIRSSNGNLKMNIYGEIRESEYQSDTDGCPARFDVIEWLVYHKTAWLPDSLDILDIGYVTEEGKYEPPDGEWRRECAAHELEGRREHHAYWEPEATPK